MAANMKDIRLRMKSVESTKQITKAMELVASSKLRKARERLESSRPFFDQVYATMQHIVETNKEFSSPYLTTRKVKKSCYVIIAGDRGLAGGYNTNVLKFATGEMLDKNSIVVPIGKKSVEFFQKRGYEMLYPESTVVDGFGLEACFELSVTLCERFNKREFDELYFVYTGFKSMISQVPNSRKILPLSFESSSKEVKNLISYDPSAEVVFDTITPQYISGLLYGALCESFASEQGARRGAMENASDNAEEILGNLSLLYNRARQGAITQEISEIVAGANAQK